MVVWKWLKVRTFRLSTRLRVDGCGMRVRRRLQNHLHPLKVLGVRAEARRPGGPLNVALYRTARLVRLQRSDEGAL